MAGRKGRRRSDATAVLADGVSRFRVRRSAGRSEPKRSILSSTPSLLRRFYRDWYRPDLMSVMAVGDFDPGQMEALIKQHFSGIQPVANARKRVRCRRSGEQRAGGRDHERPRGDQYDRPVAFQATEAKHATTDDYRRRPAESPLFDNAQRAVERGCATAKRPIRASAWRHGQPRKGTRRVQRLGAGARRRRNRRDERAGSPSCGRVDKLGFCNRSSIVPSRTCFEATSARTPERDKTASTQIINQYVAHYLSGRTGAGYRTGRISTGAAADSFDRAAGCEHARQHVDHGRESRRHRTRVPRIRTVKMPTRDEVLRRDRSSVDVDRGGAYRDGIERRR